MILAINLGTLILIFGLKYDIEWFDDIVGFLLLVVVVVRILQMIGLASLIFFVCKEAAIVSDLENKGGNGLCKLHSNKKQLS